MSFTKNTSKTISSFEDVYFDSLIPIFEKETGMYLSFYKTGGGIKKMAKGGKPSLLKKGDRVEGYFHYDHTYGQYNIIPYNAYADNSEGVVIDVFKGGIGWRYEIKFKNGETLRLGENMLGEYYDKLRFADGGVTQGLSIADANPYIAGAKAIKGIAPTSFSALDERLAKKINPDPYRPVFF